MNIWQATLSGLLLCFSSQQAISQLSPRVNSYGPINPIINFNQFINGVENGLSIRAMIRFNNCQIVNPEGCEPIRDLLQGAFVVFDFSHFFYRQENFNNQFVNAVSTFSKLFVESTSGEFFTLFSRLSIFEDNTARVHMLVFDPITHTKRWTVDWICNFNYQNRLSNSLQADLRTPLQINQHNNIQANFANNLQINPDNNLQYPLESTTFQGQNGLVFFNY